MALAVSAAVTRATEEQEETFGDKLKKLFVRPTPTPKPRKKKKTSPTPTVTPAVSVSENEAPTSSPSGTPLPLITPSPSATAKKTGIPSATISVTETSDAKGYSPEVKKVIDLGLNLTAQNLGYKYASADPAKGGMDCSGFIYYVLSNSGITDVPRDAREQYIWVRKAGNFHVVLEQRDDT